MRTIAIAGFFHETNTFSPVAADLAAFKRSATLPGLTLGDEIVERFAGLNIPVSGAMASLRAAGCALAPIAWASAVPSGRVTRQAYEEILGLIVDGLKRSKPDGVYLDLHGAMVAEHHDDAEAEIIARVRETIGPDKPIVASFDLHGNLTAEVAEGLDGIAVFETYPHLDMAETGARAAAQLVARLGAKAPVIRSLYKWPYLVPLHAQSTALAAPRTIYDMTKHLRKTSENILAAEFAFGFPPADIAGCGPASIIFGTDAFEVETASRQMERLAIRLEPEFDMPLLSPREAVARAMAAPHGPVIIADTQDNPGAGGTGNTIGLLQALIELRARDAVFAILFDPEAARLAHHLGLGAQANFSLGDHAHSGGAMDLACRVEALGDGNITATGPMYGGNRWAIGKTALLRHDGVAIMVAEQRLQAADTAILRHLGLVPEALKIIVLKSSVHFRADFGRFARDILVARAPGLHLADNGQYPYRQLRPEVRRMPGRAL